MIEFGTQIDCVHKFIYGHNNSTSFNQGETRPVAWQVRGAENISDQEYEFFGSVP